MAEQTSGTVSEESLLLAPALSGQSTTNGPRRWERSWSIQEIHAEAGNWSLAGDSGLLQHLQEFSQNIISRTHQVGKEVDDLVHEAKMMDVRVNNVINDFIMLANKQFVENRVYDEDISQEPSTKEDKKPPPEKTKEQREAELIPRVSLALQLGVNVIEHAFEKLDARIMDSDSEEEDNTYVAEPILEARDPYVTRPLPYLIGTPQFMEDDNVGLMEEMSDEEAESGQGSISVSEEESEYSPSDESGDEGKNRTVPRKESSQTMSSNSSEVSDKDMFASRSRKSLEGSSSEDVSASDEEEERAQKRKPATQAEGAGVIADELAARLGIVAPKLAADRGETNGEVDEWREKSVGHKNRNSISPDKHSVDNKKRKTDTGNDRGKHSKVIDEDEELFSQGDAQDDDGLFSKEGGLFSSSKGLFDDDDEGDLFDRKKSTPSSTTTHEKEGSLFSGELGDEETEAEPTDVDTRPRTKSGKLLPKGAVSIYGNDLTPAVKQDTSTTHTVKKPTAKPAGEANKPEVARVKPASGGGGLFDESEEDDDLFYGASKVVNTVQKDKTNSSLKAEAKKSSLFIDYNEDDGDLFDSVATNTAKKKPSNIGVTVEDYNEGEKVEEKRLEDEKLKKKATPERKLPPGAVSMFGKGPNPMVEALKKQQTPPTDEDEWSEEGKNSRSSSIHSTTSTAVKAVEGFRTAGSSSSSIFMDDGGDDELFSSKPKLDSKTSNEADSTTARNSSKLKQQVLDHKISGSTKSVKDSLFDCSDEDEKNIFGVVAKPVTSKNPVKGVSLFDDDNENVLGASKEEKAAPSSRVFEPANKKKASTLFDDEAEEDTEPLFSNKLLQTAGRKDTNKNKIQGLFAQDDLLFPSSQDENPSVDLFSNKASVAEQPSKKIETSKQSAVAPPKKATPISKGTVTKLFGGDEEDDGDLFSAGGLTNSSSAPSTMKGVHGVVETDPRHAAGVKEDHTPVVKELKKPAGAVSMFGGLDPAAVLKNRQSSLSSEDDRQIVRKDEKDIKQKEKTPIKEENASTTRSSIKSSTAFLDGEEDDDDDLFSPKGAALATVEGVTLNKDMASVSKPDPAKHWKPAGAVSLYGNLEPYEILKEKTVGKMDKTDGGSEKGRSLPPQPAPKPKLMPKGTPDENLNNKEDNVQQKEGSIRTKDDNIKHQDNRSRDDIKTKSRQGKGLFGGDDDDSDDLFSVAKEQKTPPTTAPKSPAAVTSKSFQSNSSGSPKSDRGSMSPDGAPRPKILAGAVSMFGGIDPFAGMQKKSSSLEKDIKREKSPQKDKQPQFIDPLSVLTSPVTMAATQTKKATQESPVKVEKSGVSDPLTFTSDGTCSSLEESLEASGSVDFDYPVETETLSSASKDRPRLNRRRPQSRKARVQAAESGISTGNAGSPTSTIPPVNRTFNIQVLPPLGSLASSSGAQHSNHPGASADMKSKPKHVDLFGNDDLLDGLSLSTEESLTSGRKGISNDDELFSKNLFAGSSSQLANGTTNDLFSNISNHEVFTPTHSQAASVTSEPGRTVLANEDLFSDLSRREPVPSVSSKPADSVKSDAEKSAIANKKDNFEDLFSSSAGISKKADLSLTLDHNAQSYATPTDSKVKLKSEIDDDDLFSASVKSSAARTKLTSRAFEDDDLFSAFKPATPKGDNSGAKPDSSKASMEAHKGIEVTPGAVSTNSNTRSSASFKASEIQNAKNTRPKRAVTKEATLFKDTTDIFSDIQASAPKETKKKVTKKMPEKNPFKGDIDDIFADTSAATIKPKKETKKKVATAKEVSSDNIFDDPLS